ncbi:hypothetical protein HRbin33_02013 [bacterium HR33]|nr:hypothetical protein HRbin33_02013 [bacterium HR33]
MKPTLASSLWIIASLAVAAEPSRAQFPQWSTFPSPYPDARLLPRGVLRLSFLPSYANYAELFTAEPAVTRPLGADLSADTAGSNLLVTVRDAESAIRSILADSTYRLNFGAARAELNADVRRFPLEAQLGLTGWLTLSVRVPIVKTRVQGSFRLDSTSAQAGWNQVAPDAGNAQARAQIEAVILQLEQGAATVEDGIRGGNYGCPGSQQCIEAQQLVDRARKLAGDLRRLSGVGLPAGSAIPPVAPLASSPAGQAILQEIAQVSALLQSFGAPAITGTYPLPTAPWRTEDFTKTLQAAAYGYELLPLRTVELSRLGDVEAGFTVGLLRGERLRASAGATLRLPTGTNQSPSHAFDLGTGDGQTDIEIGIDAAAESSRLALAFSARRIWQLPDRVTMRWATAEQPIAPLAFLLDTERDLGDVVQLSVHPGIRLNEAIRAYASAYYFRKGEDSFSLPGGQTPPAVLGASPPTAERMSRATAWRALYLGGGIYYRQDRRANGTRTLPIEAGLSYQAAFSGTERTPKSTMLHLYLRLYYRLWGTGSPAN